MAFHGRSPDGVVRIMKIGMRVATPCQSQEVSVRLDFRQDHDSVAVKEGRKGEGASTHDAHVHFENPENAQHSRAL